MDLVKENLENLTALWKVAGQSTGKYVQNRHFELSLSENSDWPNRLWFHNNVIPGNIERAIDVLGAQQSEVTVPIWDSNLSEISETLLSLGFREKFAQAGMSIQLDHDIEVSNRITMIKVDNELSARLWSGLFLTAFGYSISYDVLMKTKSEVQYLIGFHDDQPVGTSALFMHKPTIAGIHSMGIIPEKRRMGFAEQMLRKLLQMASIKGAEYATLQASEMGKGLYLKLGFQEQFHMKNYVKY